MSVEILRNDRGIRYIYKAYYGPKGRKGGKGRLGERAGDFACGLDSPSKDQRDLEASLAMAREDIGVVETWEEYRA